jgi:23S rRNA (adenine2503-C2)-methyltransferase
MMDSTSCGIENLKMMQGEYPNTRLDPRDQSPAVFLERAGRLSLSQRNARRWLALVIGRGECGLAACSRRGILTRRFIENTCELPRLRLEEQLVSKASNFRKLVFRTADELAVECVLIPLRRSGAVSICLSSQIGCTMRCSYCSTGRMRAQRDLRTWEIVDQYIQAREIAHRGGASVTGAVFMGMGEPFLNYDCVLAAAELLSFPIEAAISAKAITISTVGLVPQIEKFTSENRHFRLSISLGAATDEKRELLMPLAARTPVAEIMNAARRHAQSRHERVMLSYVCISGVNVSADDARALGDLIRDTPVRLDLIDVDDRTGRYFPPSPAELNSFRDALRRYVRQPVVRRYSGGSDIGAACGTLGHGQDLMTNYE